MTCSRCFSSLFKVVLLENLMNKLSTQFLGGVIAAMMVVGLSPAFAQVNEPGVASSAALDEIFETHQVSEQCGDFDLVFAIDDTGSMFGAIANVKAGLTAIITQAENKTAEDLRVGLITFKDDVTVHHALTTDIATVNATLQTIVASGGGDGPEASDMAKANAIAASSGPITVDANAQVGVVNGNFNVDWTNTADSGRVLVLVTDNQPGGFLNGDGNNAADDTNLANLGIAAAAKGIQVVDVKVPGNEASNAAFMLDASNSGGNFTLVNGDGSGTAQAVIDFIGNEADCTTVGPVAGDLLPIDATSLFVAGLAGSLTWLAPVAVGIAGAGIYIAKTRMNKGI